MNRDFVAIIVVTLLMCGLLYSVNLISNNSFPGVNSGNFVEKFSPDLNDVTFVPPVLSKDGSVLFTYHLLKIDSVTTKYFLFKKYVTLTFSEPIGDGYLPKSVSIDIPANLRSKGVQMLTPLQLMPGQKIAFNADYISKNMPYTVFNVKSWEITYLK